MMKADLSKFWVVVVISNSVRFRSRYTIYKKFEAMLKATGVNFIVAELAIGERNFEITERDNPRHLQFRSVEEYFHKESMINGAIQYVRQIDPQAREIAWIDADVFPMMPPLEWFEETWHQLQIYEVVQMFEFAQDTDPDYNQHGKLHQGFMATYIKSGYKQPSGHGIWKLGYYERHGHPGYAWAANVSALNDLGGLIDTGILGSGDRHMAMALIGSVDQSRSDELSPGYKAVLKNWEERAERYVKRDVGFVKGTIYHYWHGAKKNRGYSSRWKILIENAFDPMTELKRDTQGLWQLETHSPRQIRLRDHIRSYFRSRDEDCIYVGE